MRLDAAIRHLLSSWDSVGLPREVTTCLGHAYEVPPGTRILLLLLLLYCSLRIRYVYIQIYLFKDGFTIRNARGSCGTPFSWCVLTLQKVRDNIKRSAANPTVYVVLSRRSLCFVLHAGRHQRKLLRHGESHTTR